MKIIKVKAPYEVKGNEDLKYWIRSVGSYIGFKSEQEYKDWIHDNKSLEEVVAYK